jgi:hypothetical protein
MRVPTGTYTIELLDADREPVLTREVVAREGGEREIDLVAPR